MPEKPPYLSVENSRMAACTAECSDVVRSHPERRHGWDSTEATEAPRQHMGQ